MHRGTDKHGKQVQRWQDREPDGEFAGFYDSSGKQVDQLKVALATIQRVIHWSISQIPDELSTWYPDELNTL